VPGSDGKHGLSGIFFGRGESVAVQFEKKNACDKAGPFVSISEWMVPDNAEGIPRSQRNDLRLRCRREETGADARAPTGAGSDRECREHRHAGHRGIPISHTQSTPASDLVVATTGLDSLCADMNAVLQHIGGNRVCKMDYPANS